jgi:membrane protease YdiL (CAAX protease family)
VQLFVLIPLTGGAGRSDVIASRALIGNGMINLLGVILLAWSMAGFGEELFYRGFLIHSIEQSVRRQPLGRAFGVIVSLFWFAAGHAYQGWIGILDVGIAALLFTFLYLWRGRLIAPILAHAVYDTVLFIGLYFLF